MKLTVLGEETKERRHIQNCLWQNLEVTLGKLSQPREKQKPTLHRPAARGIARLYCANMIN